MFYYHSVYYISVKIRLSLRITNEKKHALGMLKGCQFPKNSSEHNIIDYSNFHG